jgi:hypothetical protein
MRRMYICVCVCGEYFHVRLFDGCKSMYYNIICSKVAKTKLDLPI